MSRYAIPCRQAHLLAFVGWDNPFGTFFGQVLDPDRPTDQPETVYWVGTAPYAIRHIQDLGALMAPWAVIPGEVLDRLAKDKDARTPPTRLQQWAHTLSSPRRQTP